MWSGWPGRLVLPRLCAGELHISDLHSPQPADEVSAIEEQAAASGRRQRIGKDLREGLAL